MASELPRWLMDDEEPDVPVASTANRRWLLAGLAALPWIVVVGLLISGHLAVPAPSQAEVSREDSTAESASQVPVSPEPAESDPPATDLPVQDSSWTDEGDAPTGGGDGDPPDAEAHVGAMAIAVARAWLTDVGPQVQIEGLHPHADRYLEQAVLETVDVRGEIAVATLLAVVLERDGELYTDAVVHRLAVPIALSESGAHPAGEPWWLPDPDLRPHVAELEAVDDEQAALSLAEDLTEAGYGDVAIDRLSRHPGGWLVADTTARLPDGRLLDGPVWLPEPHPVYADRHHPDQEHVPPHAEEQP